MHHVHSASCGLLTMRSSMVVKHCQQFQEGDEIKISLSAQGKPSSPAQEPDGGYKCISLSSPAGTQVT